MAYKIKRVNTKRRSWKVQWCEYKNDTEQTKDIPETEWGRLGFHLGMNFDEASKLKSSLNSLENVKRIEQSRTVISKRLKKEATILDAYLGENDVLDFEKDVLYSGFYADPELAKKSKMGSHWLAAKRALLALKIEPKDYEYKKENFYAFFARQKYSLDYVEKLIQMVNRWGKYVSRKRQQYFEPLPFPKGYNRERVADAFLEKGKSKESGALSPELLESQKSNLKPEYYNWLLISCWYGMRPAEIDSLKNPKFWRVETHEKKKVLFVYQSKLKGIAADKRWKHIPCLRPEQVVALKIIESGIFTRPLVQMIHDRFGPNINTYGGRKGFQYLMESFGYGIEYSSKWLGHKSIDRTYKNYQDKQRVVLPK